MSSEEKGDPVTLQFVQDEDRCVISSPHGVLINVLKSPHDLLLAVADALPKDASVISDLIGATPSPLINSVKGMVLEGVPDPFPDWVKRQSDASISIFGADELEFGLYLIQHRAGSAVTTLEVGDTGLGSEKELVTAQIDAEHISLVDGGLPSGELATGIVINGESYPIDDLQFYNESLKSYLVVMSKALGTHVLCASEEQVFLPENCSFIGCFALMDVLLVAHGDTERARRLLDFAAEQARLVRDYVDLARAAELLNCPKFIAEALGRRASTALRDDDRNRHLNLPFIPHLAELYCSQIEDGKKQAYDLLTTLLADKPDARSLREGADVAKRLLGDLELSSRLNDLALSLSYDEFERDSFEAPDD